MQVLNSIFYFIKIILLFINHNIEGCLMKKLFILTFLFTSSICFAQIESFDSTYVDGIKKNVKSTITEIVKDNMTLTEEQAKIFWPLFNDYIAAYDSIINQRAAIIEEYMMNYYGMDDKTAKELITKTMKLNEDNFTLKKKYLDIMLGKLPAVVVGKFFQIDARITALVDLVRMSSVPLVRKSE
jgi:chloramphenicol O-acetyltransferase